MNLIMMDVHIVLENGAQVKAGELACQREGHRSGSSFRYDPKYLKNPDAIPLCRNELPLHSPGKRKIYQPPRERSSGLHRIFESCIPGQYGLETLRHRFNLPNEISPSELLQYRGFSGSGALGFISSRTAEDMRDANNEFVDAEFEEAAAIGQKAADNLQSIDKNDAFFKKLTAVSGGLDGHRPKFLGKFDDQRWMIKLPTHRDKAANAALEAASLRTAEECGLKVPTHFVASLDGTDDPILFVERYDITEQAGRYLQQNADALMRDYADDNSLPRLGSYERLAIITQRVSTEPDADLKQLYGLMILNIGLDNFDDHAKNFEFLTTSTETRISPVFDILPNVYNLSQHSLSLRDDDSTHRNNFTRDELVDMHEFFNLSRDEAAAIIDTTCIELASWSERAKKFQASDLDAETFQAQIDKNIIVMTEKSLDNIKQAKSR